VSRTLVICGVPHAPDGSGYYRMWQPLKHLHDNSPHIVMCPPPGQQFAPTAEHASQVDMLVMQRPAGKNGVRMLENLLGHTKIVYEVDDDMLQVDPAGLPHLYDERARESIRRCMRLCDLITVSTEPLAEQIRPINPNVVVLPNHIHEDVLTLVRPKRDRLTIGWAGGHSHLPDMVTVIDPLRAVLDAHPAVDMHFAGFDYTAAVAPHRGTDPASVDAQLRRQCRWSAWEVDVWRHYTRIDFDIGIAPLAPIPFNECKSFLKALEYGALGIPTVAADLPPYRGFVIDGVTGFLVRSEDEWRARLTDLIADRAMREEMGAKAREHAAGWTIQQGWRKWADAYEALTEGGEHE
jgi:glycosyltransferase involved in cell wall biosynthesis